MKYVLALCLLTARLAIADDMPAFQPGNRILFQGDSITHGGRGGDPNHFLGHGYQYIISAKYGAQYPDRKLVFLNRGVSGDTVAKLQARWKADTLDLKPDLLSVLIGINDLSARGLSPAIRGRLRPSPGQHVSTALPKVRLVLCEPFGLPVGRNAKDAGKWGSVKFELQKRRAIVEKLAAKYHAPVVHFQKVFDDACQRAPAEYWIWDGVHPTYAGHQLMADEWVRTVCEYWGKQKK